MTQSGGSGSAEGLSARDKLRAGLLQRRVQTPAVTSESHAAHTSPKPSGKRPAPSSSPAGDVGGSAKRSCVDSPAERAAAAAAASSFLQADDPAPFEWNDGTLAQTDGHSSSSTHSEILSVAATPDTQSPLPWAGGAVEGGTGEEDAQQEEPLWGMHVGADGLDDTADRLLQEAAAVEAFDPDPALDEVWS